MKNELLASNIALAELRRLREAYREFLGPDVAVEVGVSLWYYDCTTAIKETIEVYYSTGGPTAKFGSMRDAYDRLEELKRKEEETDGDPSM